MKYYTAEEAAKKLRVSAGHVYELVKKGELKKKEGLGRTVRIPSSELKKLNVGKSYFTYDESKVEVIETHLGKVRKVKNEDAYVITDLVKLLGLSDSFTITRRLDETHYKKIEVEEARRLGLYCNQRGLILVTHKGIELYSKKSRSRGIIDFKRLLNELKVSDYEQVEFKEIDKEKSPNWTFYEEPKTSIQIFKNPEFGEIRTVEISNEPYFVGKDVATALGYAKPENAISSHVSEEDKTSTLIQGSGSNYKSKTILINESGLYSLIFGSKLESAKKFKRWVTSEVLPTIRKTGGYVNNSEKFVNNYFSSFSLEVRKTMINDLERKNRSLLIEKDRVDKALLNNLDIIKQIEETL